MKFLHILFYTFFGTIVKPFMKFKTILNYDVISFLFCNDNHYFRSHIDESAQYDIGNIAEFFGNPVETLNLRERLRSVKNSSREGLLSNRCLFEENIFR